MRTNRYIPTSDRPQTPEPEEADYRTRLLAAVNDLPPLAMVLNRLLQMLNDASCSSSQIAAMIQKDSVLSGSVIRCVNSAYYGLPHRISSIRQAVTLLGFSVVRNLALAFSMKRIMAKPRGPASKLYANYSQHALGCAVMTQFLAHYTHSEAADAAFAAGLFHDIGKLLIINTLPELVPDLTAHWEASDGPFEESELAVLGVGHAELSSTVLEKWQLPESIQEAARYHHNPSACPSSPGHGITLAHLVHASDVYVRAYGLEIFSSATRPPEPPEEAFERIGLARNLPELIDRFRAEFNSIRSVFQG